MAPHASPPEVTPLVALIEDDPVMGQSVADWLAVEGYRTSWFRNGAEAIRALARQAPDAIICDIRLPDMNGEEVHRALVQAGGDAPMLFVTGHGDIAQAVRLMQAGAADYLTKPFDIEALLRRLEALIAPRWQRSEGFALGEAPAIQSVERVLRRVAGIDSTVLLTGPSGSGKEVAARLLHAEGPRARLPFVATNCAALPAELLESEIFGHERGAFTHATSRHAGLAEQAGAGTLFLDEVAELSPPLQAKLLRLLQERVFRRLGGERDLPFRARIVAATNADLDAQVAEGRFREDLFFRLAVIRVAMPPLRDRPEDVLPLARRFLGEFAASFARPLRGFTTLAEEALLAHDHPGNVRELRNRVERAAALAEGELVTAADLFPERAPTRAEAALPTLADARDAAERRVITAALAAAGGDVARAAEALRVSRSTLFEKLRRLGLRGEG
ncbi:sigma-54-dependent transcriptional regulator [Roseococcus microcysteis]|uniref:sigma-54-dependent transcriptional regulator n=1 Tax=Roseococcus microcysteis TaxID=2771361 RepID=UPI001CC6AA7D|nr:sigma-54 dependent transcriptional regulator [Roseococcus microcysteis]